LTYYPEKDSVLTNAPHYSFAKAIPDDGSGRNGVISTIDPDCSKSKENAPKYSFPQSRFPAPGNENPAPVDYRPVVAKNNDFQYSIPQATREPKYSAERGPGTYTPNINSVKVVAPQHAVPQASRFQDEAFLDDIHLGPGCHDINDEWEKSAPHYSFPKAAQRPSPELQNFVPGPGEYEFQDEFDENVAKDKGYTMRPKLEQQVNGFLATPSPLDYHPKIAQDKVIGGDIGKQVRVGPEIQTSSQVPAPNNYQPRVELVTEHHPEYGFGTADRIPKKKDKGGRHTIYDVRNSPGSRFG